MSSGDSSAQGTSTFTSSTGDASIKYHGDMAGPGSGRLASGTPPGALTPGGTSNVSPIEFFGTAQAPGNKSLGGSARRSRSRGGSAGSAGELFGDKDGPGSSRFTPPPALHEPSIEFFGDSAGAADAGYPAGSPGGAPPPKFATLRGGGSEDAGETEGMGTSEMRALYKEASAFEGAAVISMIEREVEDESGPEKTEKALEITLEDGITITVELDSGEKRLNDLGYKQELKRVLTLFQLYAFAITTITVFAGVVPMYGQGYLNGGPVALVWYWWISVFFVHLVGLSFSEIASSFPMAGSLYFWAAALAPPRYAPTASFFTGWLEFIGPQFGLSSVATNGAFVLSALIYMCSGAVLTNYHIYGLACGTVVISSLCNLLPIGTLGHVFVFSAVFQLAAAVVLVVLLPCVAPVHQSASFVFGTFSSPLDVTLSPSQAYSFVLALLVSQFSLYGYDGVCHLAEESKRSDRNGPIAIMGSITTMSVLGWLLIVSATFSIEDPETFAFGPDTNGYAYIQILWDAFYSRYGSGLGAQIYTGIIWTSFFFGCIVGMVAAVRVCFSLARDGGFPLSRIWRQVHPTTQVPVFAVLLVTFNGLLLLLPLLGSVPIFLGITSASSVAWVGAYSVPIFFRLIQRESEFCPGPFYMADYIGVTGGKAVHLVALVWILYSVVAFNMPYVFPITTQNFNWAPVALIIALILLLLWWVVDARYWFRGPRTGPQIDDVVEVEDSTPTAAKVEFFQ